jgi:hypothetical protein
VSTPTHPEPTEAERASWWALEFDCAQAWADRLNDECEATGITPAGQIARYEAAGSPIEGRFYVASKHSHVPGERTLAGVHPLSPPLGVSPQAIGPGRMAIKVGDDGRRWEVSVSFRAGHDTYADVLDDRFTVAREYLGSTTPVWVARFEQELIGEAGTELDAQRLAHRWWAARQYPGSHLSPGAEAAAPEGA